MATKKTTDKSDETKDDVKTAGKDESVTTQTTEQAEERDVATKAEERGVTDAQAAADGGSVGAVQDGDSGWGEDYEVEDVAADEVEGAEGTVAERNADGDEYDVPYVHLTTEHFPRTSDSDDPAKSWTAQEYTEEREDHDKPVALVDVAATPGQTFRVRELPNREVMEKAGINYEQFVAGLPVRADVPHEAPRRGTPA